MQAAAMMEAYIDERLCEEVRKYPHLYCSMKGHKYIYMGWNSWREIAQNCACVKFLCMRMSQVYFARLCIQQKMKYTQGFSGGFLSPGGKQTLLTEKLPI